jgi:hypothetical protein
MLQFSNEQQIYNPPVFHKTFFACAKPVHKNIFFAVTCDLLVCSLVWIRIFENCR